MQIVAEKFALFEDNASPASVTAINPHFVAAVRNGPEITTLSGEVYGTSFLILRDGSTYQVRGYFRDVVDALASAMSGSARDAQRLDPEGAPARSSEAGDAQ